MLILCKTDFLIVYPDTKPYVLVNTLSTHDDDALCQQLKRVKSAFE